jgi:sulfatase maturation enzyme AslB (radical SAM superfamily)
MDTEATPDHYCAAPFSHLVIKANGKISPCCLFNSESHDRDSSLRPDLMPDANDPDPFFHPWMDRLRLAMLNNEPVAGCAECHARQQTTVKTLKSNFNFTYGRIAVPSLRYIEFNLGNLCNFKCRMCDSWSSSKWISDEIALGKQPSQLRRSKAQAILKYADQIDRLRFVGGEPSLEQDLMCEILQGIATVRGSLTHLEVIITTNAYVRLEDRMISLLQGCRHVNLQSSIDGFGVIGDYQRTGSNWDTVRENLLWYQENLSAPFDLYVLTSWSSINVGQAVEFMCVLANQLPQFKDFGHVIRTPSWLDIKNIPRSLKDDYKAMLDAWADQDHLEWVRHNKQILIHQLSQPADLDPCTVLEHFQELDRLRGEDIQHILPELYKSLIAAC